MCQMVYYVVKGRERDKPKHFEDTMKTTDDFKTFEDCQVVSIVSVTGSTIITKKDHKPSANNNLIVDSSGTMYYLDACSISTETFTYRMI